MLFKKEGQAKTMTMEKEQKIKNKNEGILHKCVLGIRSPDEKETKDQNKKETKEIKAAKKADMKKYNAELKKDVLPQIKEDMKLEGEAWICATCESHLNKGRMPPQCHQNSLVLKPSLQDHPETKLTDTENVLISKQIAFAKLYPLKTSRWKALDGKIINIPITNEKMQETIKCLPRTPAEGQMIGICVKRQKKYDQTYIAPFLARPGLIIKWLNELKKAGHPAYQDINIETEEQYEQRCFQEDPEGFGQLYPNMVEALNDEEDQMDMEGEDEINKDEERDRKSVV